MNSYHRLSDAIDEVSYKPMSLLPGSTVFRVQLAVSRRDLGVTRLRRERTQIVCDVR
jgi:hypothetical protein